MEACTVTFVFPEHPPYLIRIGTVGEEEKAIRPVYEIVNTLTDVVEGRRETMPDAIRFARVHAAALEEELAQTQDITWGKEDAAK